MSANLDRKIRGQSSAGVDLVPHRHARTQIEKNRRTALCARPFNGKRTHTSYGQTAKISQSVHPLPPPANVDSRSRRGYQGSSTSTTGSTFAGGGGGWTRHSNYQTPQNVKSNETRMKNQWLLFVWGEGGVERSSARNAKRVGRRDAELAPSHVCGNENMKHFQGNKNSKNRMTNSLKNARRRQLEGVAGFTKPAERLRRATTRASQKIETKSKRPQTSLQPTSFL